MRYRAERLGAKPYPAHKSAKEYLIKHMILETVKSRLVKNITPSDFMGGVLNFIVTHFVRK
jgi:hypothetical protein